MVDEISKPGDMDDDPGFRGLDMVERDRALVILAHEICGYLRTHREGDLEQIETRMRLYLVTVGRCAVKDQG